MDSITQSDWKKFKRVRDLALDRLCKRALDDVTKTASNDLESNHERYLSIYKKIKTYDKQIAKAFDTLSRSKVMSQMLMFVSMNLLDDSELEQFSDEFRADLARLSSIYG